MPIKQKSFPKYQKALLSIYQNASLLLPFIKTTFKK